MALIHYVCWRCDHCGKQSRKYLVPHDLPKGWVPTQLVDPDKQEVRVKIKCPANRSASHDHRT